MTDTAVVILVFALAALVGAGVGAYLAAKPVGEQVLAAAEAVQHDVHTAVAAIQQMQPVIEVQAPHVEWPSVLTWLIAILTASSVVNAISNIVDLRKLSKLYAVWRNGHKRHGRKERRWSRSKRSGTSTGRSSSS